MKKLLLLVLLIIGGLFIIPKFSVNAQVDCPIGDQVQDGLITATNIEGAFGNATRTCIKSNEAQFAFFKIPTYDELVALHFTKAKAPTTTISSNATESDLNFNSYPLIKVTGNLTIGAGTTGNPPDTASGPGVVFVDGNLNITKDYTYGKTSPNDSYGTVFVVKGDTVIETLVREVNAVIINQGVIYTASDPSTGGHCDTSAVATSRQLVINGSLISINDPYKDPLNPTPGVGIKFCRLLFPNSNNQPSERINLQPKYLSIMRNIFSSSLQKWAEIPGLSITPQTTAEQPTEPVIEGPKPKFPKRIFVTSTPYNGNLGGLEGADRKCQVAANNSTYYPKGSSQHLGNFAWKAWLSTDSVSPTSPSRFGDLTKINDNFILNFTLVNGTEVAADWNQLISGTLLSPINLDENGNPITTAGQTGAGVWTNTSPSGGITNTNPNSSCANWTSNNGLLRGQYGNTLSNQATWTQGAGTECSFSVFRLYCFEQVGPPPLPPQNLLANGNFENQMANWACQGAESGTCVADSTIKNSGNYSANINNTGGGSWGWQIAQGNNITASNAEQFCLSAYVKKQNASDTVQLAIQETAEPWRALEIGTAATTDWQLVQQTISKPSWLTTSTIQVYLRNYSQSSVWFDDVKLTRGTCEERY